MRLTLLIFAAFVLLIFTGCNLDAPGGNLPSTPLVPTDASRPTFIAPTPYIVPTLIPQQGFGPQTVATSGIAPTSAPRNLLTPVPAQTLLDNPQPSPNSANAIEAFVNNIIIPAWNFIYTFILEGVGTLWLFAGARGGALAQVFCCVAPGLVIVAAVALRFRLFRWRR
ncbi:MAG: hypothetical protein ABI835_14840 [Chloroflexota bacterium]